MEDTLYITLTDFNGQRYVAELDTTIPATAASLKTELSVEQALRNLRNKIVNGEPIACDIVHDNNHAKTLTIFHGPVTLSHHYPRSQPA
jgi:hypothetical protein